MVDRPIYVFYHLFAVNHWKSLLEYHIKYLSLSGLYDRMEQMYIGVVYEDTIVLNELNSLLERYPKIQILSSRQKDSLPVKVMENPNIIMKAQPGEGETIFPMVKFAKQVSKDSRFLFFHSKGASKPNDSGRSQILHFYERGLDRDASAEEKRNFIIKDMTDTIVGGWEEILKILETNQFFHYVWNFFWITGEMLQSFELNLYNRAEFPQLHLYRDRHYTAMFPVNLYEGLNNVRVVNKREIIPIYK